MSSSALLSAYLHGILDDAGCTDVVFVQDNCPGPLHSATTVEDEEESSPSSSSSGGSSSISRWDSSSSSLTNAAVVMKSPEQKQKKKKKTKRTVVRNLPRPPRRQISFDHDLDLDYSDTSIGCSSSSSRRRVVEGQENPLGLPIASYSSATTPREPTNTPPRPPPRRTSSRLRKFLLRTLETHMDCFPSSAVDQRHEEGGGGGGDSTVVTWPPPNTTSKLSTRSLLCDDHNDQMVETNISIEKIPSCKLMPSSLDRKSSSSAAAATTAQADLDTLLDLKNYHHHHLMVDDSEDDIAPPRKPRRQTSTDELCDIDAVKKVVGEGDLKDGGSGESSLHVLMRFRQRPTTTKAT